LFRISIGSNYAAAQERIREVTYNFDDLRDLLAKASPYRSGDALAGVAAESDEQRAAAQMTGWPIFPCAPFYRTP